VKTLKIEIVGNIMRTKIYTLKSFLTVTLKGQPSKCPFCKSNIVAVQRMGVQSNELVEIMYQCSHEDCKKAFIAYFNKIGTTNPSGTIPMYEYKKSMPGNFVNKEFTKTINDISPKFGVIFNQAKNGEDLGLDEIAGMGYRKALEFLLKDYIILNNPNLDSQIKTKFLGKCIDENIENVKLKEISKRAVWLGNDETHYERRWEQRDISDLKQLIDISLHWIEMEKLSANFIKEM